MKKILTFTGLFFLIAILAVIGIVQKDNIKAEENILFQTAIVSDVHIYQDGKKAKGNETNKSEGYFVNVYKDKVEIKARDFENKKWIQTVTVPMKKE